MTYDETVGASGEAPVGDQRHILAKPQSHDCTGGGEHFPHPRAALGAFISDDDDVTLFDFFCENCIQCIFLGFKDTGAALEAQAFLAGNLGHAASGS